MKCRYEFRVTSRVILDPPLRFTHHGWDFSLEADKDGRFAKLIVEVPGVQFKEHPRIEHRPGEKIPHFVIPADPMLPEVKREIRAARGALALWGVEDIDTEGPKCDWKPETAEEDSATHILGFDFRWKKSDRPLRNAASLNMVVRSLLSRQKFIPHEIPLEFFRRGQEDMAHQRFIEAIYDFYFVFEYLFGQGKFAKRDVTEAFLGSQIFRSAVAAGQKDPFHPVMSKRHVHVAFHQKYGSKSVEEVAEQVVSLRGFLHHQSLTRKANWNPGLQHEYEADAAFMQRACFEAVMDLANETVFDAAEQTDFLATPVFSPDGIRINWVPMAE